MTLEASIGQFISTDLLAGAPVGADDELLLSDMIDSLGVARLIVHLEETYGITIPPEDVVLETMQTVTAMSTYLRGKHAVTL